MKVVNILLNIISSKSCVLNKNDFCPRKQLPTPLTRKLPCFHRSLPKMTPFWFKNAGRMKLVMPVLYLYSCKNVPGRQKCFRQSSAHSPHFSCVAPFPLSQ